MTWEKELERLIKLANEFAKDEEARRVIFKAADMSEERIKKIMEKYKEIEEMRKYVAELKRKVINELDYWIEEATRGLEAKGFTVFLLKDKNEALKKFKEIVRDERVLSAKSLTAWEVGISNLINVMETDIGMFVVKLANSNPVHTTAPALHFSRRKVYKILKENGLNPKSDKPEDLVKAIAEYLRREYCRMKIGLVGANAIAAEGAIVNIEGEGNIRIVSSLPEKLIVIGGVEKIVPTVIDAVKVALIQAAFAGRYPIQLNLIAGPTATSDIERVLVRGAQGPKEVYAFLIDNGRRGAEGKLREQLYCVRCGRCLLNCPLWRHFPMWGGIYKGPMGVGWTAITEGLEKGKALATMCLKCGRCNYFCPMEIDLIGVIREVIYR